MTQSKSHILKQIAQIKKEQQALALRRSRLERSLKLIKQSLLATNKENIQSLLEQFQSGEISRQVFQSQGTALARRGWLLEKQRARSMHTKIERENVAESEFWREFDRSGGSG